MVMEESGPDLDGVEVGGFGFDSSYRGEGLGEFSFGVLGGLIESGVS